jgi:hypothetical protein
MPCTCDICVLIREPIWDERKYIIYKYEISQDVLNNKDLEEKLQDQNPEVKDFEKVKIYYVGQTSRDIKVRIAQHKSKQLHEENWCQNTTDWGEYMKDGTGVQIHHVGKLSDYFEDDEIKKGILGRMMKIVVKEEEHHAILLKEEGHASYCN